MIVYPAIDIRGAQAVRLIEGDYDRETVFDADPVDPARRWAHAGASWIHLVDLDGARDGVRTNADAIRRIVDAVPCRLELGGGLRTIHDLEAAAELGVERMIIGSAAVTNPAVVSDAVRQYGDRIAVGLDARNGMLATHGWREQSDVSALDAARRFADVGVRHIIFTDIARDGKLQGPNFAALSDMIDNVDAGIIASGGISSLEDVAAVRDCGAVGVIVGAALYHRAFRLEDALAIAAEEPND